MKISVVIPAFNEEKLIGSTLAAVGEAEAAWRDRGWESEIVVCDNNSKDQTAEIARAFGAIVVFEPINQIGRARNAGANAATGDWLVFVDADSIPTRELFDDVAKAIERGRAVAGGSTVRMDCPIWSVRLVASFWNGISRVLRWVAGSFIFCEARAFRELGGFNHEFFAGEELDLSRRLKRYARQHDRKVVILSEHPLLTSSRKVQLYRGRELVGFFVRALFRPNATMKNRAACSPWYDGRR